MRSNVSKSWATVVNFQWTIVKMPVLFSRTLFSGGENIHPNDLAMQNFWIFPRASTVVLKVVTNEKGEAVGDVLTIIC
jgi:hypothetical protein